MTFANSLLSRLDASDRALFVRWSLPGRPSSRLRLWVWKGVTHLGSAQVSIAVALLPVLLWIPELGITAMQPLIALAASHLLVRLVKQRVARERPYRKLPCEALIPQPTCFSFPSGHATASMSVALVYASAVPELAVPLMLVSVAVGFSRVRLGVHYPGDVLAGQVIALLSGAAVIALF